MQIAITDIAKNAATLYRTKQNGRPLPIYLEGPPGCGKSAVLTDIMPNILERGLFANDTDAGAERQVKPNMSWSAGGTVCVITEILSTVEYIDVRGAQLPVKDKDTGRWDMAWITPSLIKIEQEAYAAGAKAVIMFFDELPQADAMTQKAVVDIMLNGRVGEYGLQRSTWCVAAGNHTKHAAGANRLLSILRNRVVNYDVFMPLEQYTKWARRRGHPTVALEFLGFRPDLIAEIQPTKDGAFLSNRSFTQACELINASNSAARVTDPMHLPDDEFTKQSIDGVIGEAARIELYAYAADVAHLPKPHEVEASPTDAKVPDEKNLAAQYAAAQLVIRIATPQNADRVWQYAERLIKDMQAATANALLSNNFGGVLLNAPNFRDWIAENKALITASTT